jgi:hypothetical protein
MLFVDYCDETQCRLVNTQNKPFRFLTISNVPFITPRRENIRWVQARLGLKIRLARHFFTREEVF